MKYDYLVIYNGKLYRAGEEVPVVTEEKASVDNEKKIIPENGTPENEGADGEKIDDEEETVTEVKKAFKRRTKA